jgi:hypothetical protein
MHGSGTLAAAWRVALNQRNGIRSHLCFAALCLFRVERAMSLRTMRED